MTDEIKKEARREGDWEMVSSASKPTGDRCGDTRGGRRQVCETIMKMVGRTVQSCVDLRVVGLIVDRSSAPRAEQSSQRVTGERMRGETRGEQLFCAGIKLRGGLSPPGDVMGG
ncbi:unnamed protein product [Pleuronectes platessa]|uniref:Uncharacterized protein n=1 Tax=Pleuronectes platessa TaxID=8262 RepID=A0A9N7Z7X5_PLEPL|nr:unnamed protein product [Pleuronectes platessa]